VTDIVVVIDVVGLRCTEMRYTVDGRSQQPRPQRHLAPQYKSVHFVSCCGRSMERQPRLHFNVRDHKLAPLPTVAKSIQISRELQNVKRYHVQYHTSSFIPSPRYIFPTLSAKAYCVSASKAGNSLSDYCKRFELVSAYF